MIEYVESTEGETRRFDFELSLDGVAMPLSGTTAHTLELTPRGSNTTTAITVGVSVIDAPSGLVGYSPTDGVLLQINSPYRWRFRLLDSSGKRHFFPNQHPGTWVVQKP